MELFFLSAAIIFLISSTVLLKLYLKAKRESLKKDETLASQLKQIEIQSKAFKNLSDLYESTIQYDKDINDFFTNITHELKTPLSVILGAIQLTEFKSKAAAVEQARYDRTYQIIRHNCYRLLRLANNLLDFARMDAGHFRLNQANCNVVSLIEDITQSVIPYARQKQIELIFDTHQEEIITALDLEKIERVILNLLSNAIKFTSPGGHIYVTVRTLDGKVFISVRDTGIGIPKEKQLEIFERFRQVGSRRSRDYEGSGIGLSIVKSFIDMHQGTICVTSEEDKGSEFVISLPIVRLGSQEEKQEKPLISDQSSKITEAIKIEFSSSIAF